MTTGKTIALTRRTLGGRKSPKLEQLQEGISGMKRKGEGGRVGAGDRDSAQSSESSCSLKDLGLYCKGNVKPLSRKGLMRSVLHFLNT